MFTTQPTSDLDMSATDTLSVDELVDELATLAAHISAGMCRWLELVGEFDRRGKWAGWGHRSCAEWLAWRCALTPRSAREHVRVARALSALPMVQEAFSRGEVSYAKVRALTRVGAPRKEAELLELAAVMTASQLERALSAYRRVTSAEARELHEQEQLEYYWDEDGELFIQAIDAARERLWQAGRNEERGSAEPRRPSKVDALVAVADTALAHPDTGRTGGDRYQVVVHIDHAALTGDDDEGSCVLADGPALAPETARRLACDASLVTLDERSATPLNVGRKTRTIPRALRRALTARDRGCRFPGCTNHRYLDAHHIHHWADGGETKLDNLLHLCRRHHRLLHEGGCTVDPHGRFYDHHGHLIPPVPAQPPATIAALRHANSDLDVTPNTCTSGHGDRMDIDLTVDALLGIIGRPDRPRVAKAGADARGAGTRVARVAVSEIVPPSVTVAEACWCRNVGAIMV
jgi:hypothetical protein